MTTPASAAWVYTVTVYRARPGLYLLRCQCGWDKEVYSDRDTANAYADGHRRRHLEEGLR